MEQRCTPGSPACPTISPRTNTTPFGSGGTSLPISTGASSDSGPLARPIRRSTIPKTCSASSPKTSGSHSTCARSWAGSSMVPGSRSTRPLYGTSLVVGFASVNGFAIGVIANQQGVIFSEEAQKATEFIQLCNRYDTPLLFIHNTTGYMVGKSYEQRGIIKDGAKMINAVANSTVPHIALMAGVSYGAGNYGMSGKSYNPRFVFGWPNHKVAVMGPKQLAGVMSIIARQAAEEQGREFDVETDEQRRALIEAQIGYEEQAYFSTARIRDDGLFDPRDTRTVLGIALSAIHSNEVKGTAEFGVFRM